MRRNDESSNSDESDPLNHPFCPENESQNYLQDPIFQSSDNLEADQNDKEIHEKKLNPNPQKKLINSPQKLQSKPKQRRKKVKIDLESGQHMDIPKKKKIKKYDCLKKESKSKQKILKKIPPKKLLSSKIKDQEDIQIINNKQYHKVQEDKQKKPKQQKHEKSCFKNKDKQKRQALKSNGQRRKRRKVINQSLYDKITAMFTSFKNQTPYQGKPIKKLKSIALELNLGYSTILHKYKQFQKNNEIQKGVILASEGFKRSYKKSIKIKEFIRKALREGIAFYNCRMLADFISKNYKYQISRSIVARQLSEMKEEKNLFKRQKRKIKLTNKKPSNAINQQ